MPDMDGLETVRELRKIDSRVPIIMFSSLTERGAAITLEALSLGATDYVAKPSNVDMNATLEAIARELIPKIRALCRLPKSQGSDWVTKSTMQSPVPVSSVRRPLAPVQLVAIGSSTGGPDALAKILPLLPSNLRVPLVIAQHMPPIFTAMLAMRLSSKSAVRVRECVSGERPAAGCAVIAPGDFHMEVAEESGTVCLRTHQGPKENYCRPSVDVLFRSVARLYGPRALAVILTGMGQDGLKGCKILRESGARIYVQDEASSVVWGMPGFVARGGFADKILPLNQIAAEIVRATNPQLAAAQS
jgi:two-component system chemotaxis response regulator CheB